MRYEIHRKESCRPESMSRFEWLLRGRSRVGKLSTTHPDSSYGQPAIIVPEWGGLIDYADVEKICIIKDGETEDQLVAEYNRLSGNFGQLGIKVSW